MAKNNYGVVTCNQFILHISTDPKIWLQELTTISMAVLKTPQKDHP